MPTEFDLIRRYFTHAAPRTVLGVGDDAALIRASRGKLLAVAADMLVGGRHFFRDADAESVGHKALAVNLSDMAAMGAVPRWALHCRGWTRAGWRHSPGASWRSA